jgi:DNA-binding NtrC family response regulator
MSPSLQSKILRVLEDGLVVPIGSNEGFHVDVRIISATDTDLKSKVDSGVFRKDLYYRLAGYTVEIPPLRTHKGDIPPLACHFAGKIAGEMGMKPALLSREAIQVLTAHDYPGNARELRNVIERALIESDGHAIEPRHLHFPFLAPPVPMSDAGSTVEAMPLNFKEAEAALVRRAMAQARGNVSEAARLLGLNRTRLYRKLATLPR